jgi:hypothetical protein
MAPVVRPLGSLSMARSCARIDSRPDTAKIASADRVGVHHARLLAVIGVRKTFPHGLGQSRKYSRRADDFRSSPESGHCAERLATSVSCQKRHRHPISPSVRFRSRTSRLSIRSLVTWPLTLAKDAKAGKAGSIG